VHQQVGGNYDVEVLLRDDCASILHEVGDAQRFAGFLLTGQCHHPFGNINTDHFGAGAAK